MLLSSNFSGAILIRMFISFLGYELICLIFLFIYYPIIMNNQAYSAEETLKQSSKEVMQSYTQYYTGYVLLFKEHSVLVSKEMDILNSLTTPSTESCMITNEEVSNYSYYFEDEDIYPIKRFFLDFMEEHNNSHLADDSVVSDLVEEMSEKDSYFDHISYYKEENSTDIEDVHLKLCQTKTMMKSLIMENILKLGNFASLKSFYLFFEDEIFVYPPREIDLRLLREDLIIYQGKTYCEYHYSNECITENLLSMVYMQHASYFINKGIDPTDTTLLAMELYRNRFAAFDFDTNRHAAISCVLHELNLANGKGNWICAENFLEDLVKVYQNNFENFDLVSLMPVVDPETGEICDQKLVFFLRTDSEELEKMYSSEFLGDYRFSGTPMLFHILYYDIFKYTKNIGQSLVEDLIEDYKEIEGEVLRVLNDLYSDYSNELNETVVLDNYVFEKQYNQRGDIDERKLLIYLIYLFRDWKNRKRKSTLLF
ncbi:MAG: hypothetical protein MJ252_10745 [archaeon]|nr:hypothetical protein [archaeon]